MANAINRQEVAVMGTLVNHVPELLRRKGWDVKTFAAKCMLAGLSQDTAYRLVRGETQFTTETLATVAGVLGVSRLGEIIEMNGGEQ